MRATNQRDRPMKRKGYRSAIIGVILLCGIAMSHAQEPNAPEANRWQINLSPEPIPYMQGHKQVDPFYRKRCMAKEALAQRAQEQSVLLRRPEFRKQEVETSIKLWRFEVSNTQDNRSLFPDARLDARTLRFPLPRHMTPGNRIVGSRVDARGQIKR